jgi:hypothetical protein
MYITYITWKSLNIINIIIKIIMTKDKIIYMLLYIYKHLFL